MSSLENVRPHAFNYQLQRLMIGLVSFALPLMVMIIGCSDLTSISASYHTDSRDVFVASLAAIGLLMITYQGKSGNDKYEFWLSKLGGIAAIIVAFVPTACPAEGEPTFGCLVQLACDSATEKVTMAGTSCDYANEAVHISAAAVVFACLFFLCSIFRKRALEKFNKEKCINARRRSYVYRLCMAGIILGALIIGLDKTGIMSLWDTAFFWGEAIMLFSFSIAWLTASKIILWDRERPSLLPL